ncbi:MAG: hypothetical protein HWQ41_19565 [Nostoc sp. NOS(2021)]|uniref:hypothetical protein n=1 Tax=Nostoc sp. NOS(2021) TaxID=2815407 RepID=UPI0025FD7AA2|nr:hypothetical protein [Nostoc sp. NOS(2021)]MBN3897394.1 hypothetical protein [Nostoc sp. NOS(2021)]
MERGSLSQRESFLPFPPAPARSQKPKKSSDLLMSIRHLVKLIMRWPKSLVGTIHVDAKRLPAGYCAYVIFTPMSI